MAVTDVYQFYRSLEDEQIVLSFKGEFTAELLTSFLHIMENKMEELNTDPRKRKRVFNVLIECFQNLYHHIETNSDSLKEGLKKSALIIVKHVDGKFIVRTGNHIDSSGKDELKSKLDMVNALSSDELRQLYKMKLENDPRTPKGTAGLGLIDIARKSKNKLGYEFIDIDKSDSFFCLNVNIE